MYIGLPSTSAPYTRRDTGGSELAAQSSNHIIFLDSLSGSSRGVEGDLGRAQRLAVLVVVDHCFLDSAHVGEDFLSGSTATRATRISFRGIQPPAGAAATLTSSLDTSESRPDTRILEPGSTR